MPVKSSDYPDELKGPDVPEADKKKRHMYHSGAIPKNKRRVNKGYLKFISELPCISCHIKDGTIVPHHLKGRGMPVSGGAGYKASDIFTMPLCFECHADIHSGNTDLLDNQFWFIIQTLDKAIQAGVLSAEYKPYEHYNVL
jgi:hypothetical protein